MYIKQISVFIENRKGRLAEFCRLLPYLAQKFGIPVDKL